MARRASSSVNPAWFVIAAVVVVAVGQRPGSFVGSSSRVWAAAASSLAAPAGDAFASGWLARVGVSTTAARLALARTALDAGSTVGGAAEGVTITLSALDPNVAAMIEGSGYHQKPVTIYRVITSDADKHTPLAAAVFMRGRLDTVPQRYKVGGDAALDFNIEGPRKDMNRGGGRIGSDSDQRVLGGVGDAAYKHVNTAARKTMVWGQKPSTIGGGFGGGLVGAVNGAIFNAVSQ